MPQEAFEIHIEITSACTLKCIHCSSNAMRIEHPSSAYKGIKRLLSGLCNRFDVHVYITGGEPLASPQVLQVLKDISDNPKISHIGSFTSGCFAPKGGHEPLKKEWTQKLHKLGLRICYVSLYGDSKDIHDSTTGVPGSFQCSIKSMEHLLMAGIDVRVHLPIMRHNMQRLVKVCELAHQIGASEVRFLRLVKHGRAEANWDKIGLSRQDQKIAISDTIAAIQKRLEIRTSVAAFPETWKCRPTPTAAGCQAGQRLYYIDWCGQIFPCACKKNDEHFCLGRLNGETELPLSLAPKQKILDLCLQDSPIL